MSFLRTSPPVPRPRALGGHAYSNRELQVFDEVASKLFIVYIESKHVRNFESAGNAALFGADDFVVLRRKFLSDKDTEAKKVS